MDSPLATLPILTFTSASDFETWLATHHGTSDGAWVRFFKKDSGKQTFVYLEAVDIALCYGWIDSQVQKYDAESYLQKFTPRKKRSLWSKINQEKVARLIKEGRMKPAGLAEVERAKMDGRWDRAYAPPSTMTVPEEFLTELKKHPKAQAFFATLNKTNTYAISWRLHTAQKPEIKKRRIEEIIAKLERGEQFHA